MDIGAMQLLVCDSMAEGLDLWTLLGHSTTLQLSGLDARVSFIAKAVGLRDDGVRFAGALLLNFFFSGIIGVLGAARVGGRWRAAFALVIGIFESQVLFGPDWLHLVVPSVAVYLWLQSTRKLRVLDGGPRMLILFVGLFGELLVMHAWRTCRAVVTQATDRNPPDVSGSMVSVGYILPGEDTRDRLVSAPYR